MTLALFLAHYGVRSMLIERNPDTTRHPKMDLTSGRSMELFKKIGLAEKLRDAGVPRQNSFDVTWVTRLSGHELHRFRYPSARDAGRLIRETNDGSQASEPGLRVSQIVIEPVLKHAIEENALIDARFGVVFDGILTQDADGVTVDISSASTGAKETVHCRYLAGCDGGGSRVRRQIGIELDGDMEVAGAYMVHFRTTDRTLFRRWGTAWHYQNGAGTIIAQNDDDIYTLQAWLLPGMDPSKMKAEEVLEGWVGEKFDYEILQANPWAANLVVAQKYVRGRVVLAGDSAHQFIPTGGYGMNSGIADAGGLSWMLAALLQGWGGQLLLDAYDAERRPTAWWHLAASRRHMGVRGEMARVYAEGGDLEECSPAGDARRAKAAAEIAALGNAENESWGIELGYRYDESPIIQKEPGAPDIDPLTYRANTWPGTRLPQVFLESGISIHDKLGRYFTLIVLDDSNADALLAAAQQRGIPLDVLRLDRPDLRTIYERNFVLVRPDQHVAWRGDRLPEVPEALCALIVGASESQVTTRSC